MQELLKPIRTESLKEVFVSRFENLILSGKLTIGQRLPSERELALQLGVSRPVVHEGLVDLAAKGLVSMKPRVGSVVNDFRTQGSLALLNSLFNYHDGQLEPDIQDSLLDMRRLFEVETARLASLNRTAEQLHALTELLRQEQTIDPYASHALAEVDFKFHHLIALATGNLIYPLLINSCKQFYTNLSGQFFRDPNVVPKVFGLHRELVAAIEDQNAEKAAYVMTTMLHHGEQHLKAIKEGL
jgi:GntR family transcriptional regulator, transcriptional repressor for pyruvate dehydrogenase complex